MYSYAKRYVEHFSLPIECRYLYCSRYSLRVPMYHLDLEEALDYITLGGLDVSLDKLMRRAAMTKEQEEKVFRELKLDYKRTEQLPRDELGRVREALGNCKSFMKYLQQNSREAMPALMGYIRQEGLLDELPMALVDSGWVGSMQKQINRLIHFIKEHSADKEEKACKADRATGNSMDEALELEGYYWGLYDIPSGVGKDAYHGFYFTPEKGIRRKAYFNNCLFEGVFSAPHGMTMGYEVAKELSQVSKPEDKVCPRLGDIASEKAGFLQLTKESLEKWQRRYIEENAKNAFRETDFWAILRRDTHTDRRKEVERLMGRWMSRPSREEAYVYGQLSFSDDVLEYSEKQMAEPMTEKELWANHLLLRIFLELLPGRRIVKQSAWYEGSAVLYGKWVWCHRVGYRMYRYYLYLRQRRIWRQKNHE